MRVVTGIWALWFAAVLIEPGPLTMCLMPVTMGAGTMAGMSQMQRMPGMDGAASMPTTPSRNQAPVDPTCMHLGACCCAPVITAPVDVVPPVPAPPIRIVRVGRPDNVASTPPSAPAHAHPFAIGPPASVA